MRKAIIWIVVVIILAVAGYFIYTNYMTADTGGETTGETPQGDVVQAQDVTVGTGAEAKPGSIVSVLYVGRLSDGTVFDSSEAHNNEPLRFQLGAQGIIPGFQIGINGMKEGGERLIAIPPAFGYGDNPVRQDPNDPASAVVIPGKSTLIFNIKLVKVEEAPPATTTSEATE